jgi:hypothetical protein
MELLQTSAPVVNKACFSRVNSKLETLIRIICNSLLNEWVCNRLDSSARQIGYLRWTRRSPLAFKSDPFFLWISFNHERRINKRRILLTLGARAHKVNSVRRRDIRPIHICCWLNKSSRNPGWLKACQPLQPCVTNVWQEGWETWLACVKAPRNTFCLHSIVAKNKTT